MVKVGIIGALGYTGKELIKYLLAHNDVRIVSLWDKAVAGKGEEVESIYPEFKNILNIKVKPFDSKDLKNTDVVFLALPHTVSVKLAPKIMNKVKLLIDLSADYRFKNFKVYEKWYGIKHTDKSNLKKAVYGLPEIDRDGIKGAKFIENPGCFPTSVILGLYPLAKEGLLENAKVIVDSKTGTSGAGRKASQSLLFSELNENIRPYKLNKHQHMPEIISFFENLKIKVNLNFIPQVVPLTRGIISMIYVVFENKKTGDLYKLYKKCYCKEQFIRLCAKGEVPELRNVANSNFCDLGFLDFLDKNTFLTISCIDNLGKGAASQAVQNMNVALGFKESEGLL